jgi:DNA-binding transcriptional LysR family regulator
MCVYMNLRWMMLFATIAEEGSFTRAAARLNIAQPWLSAQMRKLEYELGVQLLVRKSSGVQPTPEGEALLPYAKQLSEAVRMFRETARRMGDIQTKTVRLGTHLPMLDISSVRQINKQFASTYLNFSLDATVSGTPDLIRRLEQGEFDLVVAMAPLPESRTALETIELQDLNAYVIAPADAGITNLDALKGRNVNLPPEAWHPQIVEELSGRLHSVGATTRTVPEFDRRAIEHLVKVHRVFVVLIDDAFDQYRENPEISAIAIPEITAKLVLIRPANSDIGRGAERFWSLTQAHAKKLQKSD